MNNEQREQQMMTSAEAYAEDVGYKDEHDLCNTLNVFCAGWRAADSHPQWIPVEEELPKEDGRYWCCDDDDGQEELIWRNGHWYGLLDPYPIEGVTHWMQLPTPPQRKEE